MVGTSALGQGAGRRYETFNILVECALQPPKHGRRIQVEAVLDDGCTHSCIGADSLDIFEWDWVPALQPAVTVHAETANGTVETLGSLCLYVQLHPELTAMKNLIVQVFPGNCPLLLGGDVLSAHTAVHRHRKDGGSEYTLTSPHGDHTIILRRVARPTVYLTDTSVGVRADDHDPAQDLEYLQAVLGPSVEDIDNEGPETVDIRPIGEILLGQKSEKQCSLTSEQKKEWEEVLEQYNHCFLRPGEISKIPPSLPDSFRYEVKLREGYRAKAGTRPSSPEEFAAWGVLLKRLLRGGLIQRAPQHCKTSSYASLLLKKDSDGNVSNLRLVIDYRQINKYIVVDDYPLPRMEDLWVQVANKTVYVMLDLAAGFYNIRMDDPVSREALAFKCPLGLYVFCVCPMGPSNSPANMQRYMDALFWELILDGKLGIYMEDLIIMADSVDEALETFKRVLQIVDRHNLRFKLKKVKLCMEEIECLGKKISHQQISVLDSRMAAIQQFPQPQNVGTMRSFVGLAEQFRAHCPHIAEKLKPLTATYAGDTTRKSKKAIAWTSEVVQAFEEVKTLLQSPEVLRPFDCTLETVIYTDASLLGAGAILLQREESKEFHLVAIWSHAWAGAEGRWSTTDHETYAVFYSICREWRHLLATVPFVVFTDHNATRYLLHKSISQLSPRESRWAMNLSMFDIEIRHIPGTENNSADLLSRLIFSPERVWVIFDLFAGAGTLLRAINSGWPPQVRVHYYAVEKNPTCRAMILHLLERVRKPLKSRFAPTDIFTLGHDVHDILAQELRELIPPGAASLIMAGPSCQPFSRAGAKRGLRDPREGFTALARLISAVDFYVVENVDFSTHLPEDFEQVNKWLGTPAIVNLQEYCAQNRIRCVWSNSPLHKTIPQGTALSAADVLDPGWRLLSGKEKLPTLMASPNSYSDRNQSSLVTNSQGDIRKMNIAERERAVGLHEGDTAAQNTNVHDRIMATGNAIPVPYLACVLTDLEQALGKTRFFTPDVRSTTMSNSLKCFLSSVHSVAGTEQAAVETPPLSEEEKDECIDWMHNNYCHVGILKTVELLKQSGVRWPNLLERVRDRLSSCTVCQQAKSYSNGQPPLLTRPVDFAPMQTVHVDICQLEESFDTAQECCLIVAVDRFTRFTWAIPTRKDPTCQECLDKLDDYIWMSFGYPATIVSDNAQNLNSTLWATYFAAHHVETKHSTAYYPQGNGPVERANRTILERFRAEQLDGGRFPESLIKVMHSINHTTSTVTGYTPHRLMFAYPARLAPLPDYGETIQAEDEDNTSPSSPASTEGSSTQTRPEAPGNSAASESTITQVEATDSDGDHDGHEDQLLEDDSQRDTREQHAITATQARHTANARQRARHAPLKYTPRVGDLVWYAAKVDGKHKHTKLSPHWAGPKHVLKVLDNIVVLSMPMSYVDDTTSEQTFVNTTIPISRIKPFVQRRDSDRITQTLQPGEWTIDKTFHRRWHANGVAQYGVLWSNGEIGYAEHSQTLVDMEELEGILPEFGMTQTNAEDVYLYKRDILKQKKPILLNTGTKKMPPTTHRKRRYTINELDKRAVVYKQFFEDDDEQPRYVAGQVEYFPGGDVFMAKYTDNTTEQLTHAEVLQRIVGQPHRGNLLQVSRIFSGDIDDEDTQSHVDPTNI